MEIYVIFQNFEIYGKYTEIYGNIRSLYSPLLHHHKTCLTAKWEGVLEKPFTPLSVNPLSQGENVSKTRQREETIGA